MTMRELLAKRESIRTELRAIHEGANGGALAADAQARWTALESEAAALAGLESRQATIDDLDRRAAGTTIHAGADTRFEELAAQVTFLDNVRAQCGGTDAACGRAREVSAELARRSGRAPEGLLFSLAASGAPREQRTFTTTNPAGGPGSNLIQTTVSANLIDRLREKCLVRQMGATVLGGLVGNLAVPRLKASATAQWVAENTGITSTDPQTDQVNLTPKHCGAMYSISRNMIMQPSVDVTRMAENDMTRLLAVALDQVALVGGGTNQPSGLLAAGSGITIVSGGANGAAPAWTNVVNLIGAVDQSNALNGDSLGFITNAKAVKAMRQTLKTSVDTSSNFIMTDPNMLAGYALGSTQNVPANFTKGTGTALSALIFGDWSQLLLGFWSELDILVNPYDSTAYAAGGVLIRAMMTCDVEIRHPLAFAAIADLIAP
jgi:HK97 family phage major capsid protein